VQFNWQLNRLNVALLSYVCRKPASKLLNNDSTVVETESTGLKIYFSLFRGFYGLMSFFLVRTVEHYLAEQQRFLFAQF
jgi:hypothetical protein